MNQEGRKKSNSTAIQIRLANLVVKTSQMHTHTVLTLVALRVQIEMIQSQPKRGQPRSP